MYTYIHIIRLVFVQNTIVEIKKILYLVTLILTIIYLNNNRLQRKAEHSEGYTDILSVQLGRSMVDKSEV